MEAPRGIALRFCYRSGDMVALHPQYPDAPQLAVGGRLFSGQSAVAVSNDRGTSWRVVTLPGTCRGQTSSCKMGRRFTGGLRHRGGLYRSQDDGLQLQMDRQYWPRSSRNTRRYELLATDSGVWEWHQDNTLEPFSMLGRPITAISSSPDGTIWVGSPETDSQYWMPPEKPGVGWPEGDYVEALAISSTGEVAVALSRSMVEPRWRPFIPTGQ